MRICNSGENSFVVAIRVAPFIVPISRNIKPVIQCIELKLKKISFAARRLKFPMLEVKIACDMLTPKIYQKKILS